MREREMGGGGGGGGMRPGGERTRLPRRSLPGTVKLQIFVRYPFWYF